jgi:hypothetical protein
MAEKPGWRPLRRLIHRWTDDNNKMDLRETERGGINWSGLALDRDQWRDLMHMVINLEVP